MITVLVADHRSLMENLDVAIQTLPLPDRERNKIGSFRRKQDAAASLGGKILLKNLLARNGLSTDLTQLHYNDFGMPYFDEGPFFSITHAGDHVACALSLDHVIGLDLEKQIPVDINEFKSAFCPDELGELEKTIPVGPLFFKLWTRKEAIIKATGKGLSVAVSSFSALSEVTVLDNITYYTRDLVAPPSCAFAVAAPQLLAEVSVSQFRFLYDPVT